MAQIVAILDVRICSKGGPWSLVRTPILLGESYVYDGSLVARQWGMVFDFESSMFRTMYRKLTFYILRRLL